MHWSIKFCHSLTLTLTHRRTHNHTNIHTHIHTHAHILTGPSPAVPVPAGGGLQAAQALAAARAGQASAAAASAAVAAAGSGLQAVQALRISDNGERGVGDKGGGECVLRLRRQFCKWCRLLQVCSFCQCPCYKKKGRGAAAASSVLQALHVLMLVSVIMREGCKETKAEVSRKEIAGFMVKT
jgi:hypothetical protein